MRKEVVVQSNPKSPISEAFRTLRTNIQFMNTNRKMKTLLVTSVSPNEGKSWITSNLAVTFAQAGKKVILIDADMRKGRQYNIFKVSPTPGLSNYLSELEDDETINDWINDFIQETEIENLYVISAGDVPPNPSELLLSTQMGELLNKLKQVCDIVIIDGSPCDVVTDSIILSRIVDSTIIVVEQNKTKKDNLDRVIKNIKNVGGNIIGVVLNKTQKSYSEGYYYRYGEGNQNEKAGKQKRKYIEKIRKIKEGLRNKLNSLKKEKTNNNIEQSNDGYEDIKNLVNQLQKEEQNNQEINQNNQEIKQNDQSQEPAQVANDTNNNTYESQSENNTRQEGN